MYRCTSFNGSLASSTPDNTAIPLAPVAITFAVFSTVTPPIAITGREVDWTTACRFFTPRDGTSFFESLGKIWQYIKLSTPRTFTYVTSCNECNDQPVRNKWIL